MVARTSSYISIVGASTTCLLKTPFEDIDGEISAYAMWGNLLCTTQHTLLYSSEALDKEITLARTKTFNSLLWPSAPVAVSQSFSPLTRPEESHLEELFLSLASCTHALDLEFCSTN